MDSCEDPLQPEDIVLPPAYLHAEAQPPPAAILEPPAAPNVVNNVPRLPTAENLPRTALDGKPRTAIQGQAISQTTSLLPQLQEPPNNTQTAVHVGPTPTAQQPHAAPTDNVPQNVAPQGLGIENSSSDEEDFSEPLNLMEQLEPVPDSPIIRQTAPAIPGIHTSLGKRPSADSDDS